MCQYQMKLLAEMIDDDPSVVSENEQLINEWNLFGGGLDRHFTDPTEKQLSAAIDPAHVKRVGPQQAMQELRYEFDSFARMYKLQSDRALELFIKYKTTGESPGPSRDEGARQLNRRGGGDLRNDMRDPATRVDIGARVPPPKPAEYGTYR